MASTTPLHPEGGNPNHPLPPRVTTTKHRALASTPPSGAEHRTPSPSEAPQRKEDNFVQRIMRKTKDFSYADMDMTDNQSPIYVSDHETNRRKKKKKKKKNKAKKNKRNRRNANRHAKELANITLNHPSLPTSHDHDEQRGAWVVGVSTSEIEALDANPDAGRNPSVEDTGHVSNKHKVEVAKRRGV